MPNTHIAIIQHTRTMTTALRMTPHDTNINRETNYTTDAATCNKTRNNTMRSSYDIINTHTPNESTTNILDNIHARTNTVAPMNTIHA